MAINGVGDFFAIDIGTTAVRVAQLSPVGTGGWNLTNFGYAPLDEKTATSISPESRRKLSDVIMTAVGQSGIKAKNVAVGLPSSKTFTAIVEVPLVSEVELRNMMKYQVDQYIPMATAGKINFQSNVFV